MSLPPGGQIQKSIWLKCCTLIDFIICHKFAIHSARKVWTGTMIFRLFPIFRHIDAPWWPITQINITECRTLIHFMICYKIAIHCVCKLWTVTMILWFLPISRHVQSPWGQIQKSIWLKFCTPIDFMICHKFSIHCVCKLWTENDETWKIGK